MESLLVRIAKERFTHPTSQIVHFVEDNDAANDILNNLEQYPHAYVLACLMDRQIKAERAWVIPYAIYKQLNSFHLDDLAKIGLPELKRIFNSNKLHRFNDTMASVFHEAVLKIKNNYEGNAANIWSNNPSSSAVVYRFLELRVSEVLCKRVFV